MDNDDRMLLRIYRIRGNVLFCMADLSCKFGKIFLKVLGFFQEFLHLSRSHLLLGFAGFGQLGEIRAIYRHAYISEMCGSEKCNGNEGSNDVGKGEILCCEHPQCH